MLKFRSGLVGLTLASALVLAAASANAADMYRGEGGLKDGPVYVPVTSWTGFYVGAHVGAAWGDLQTTDFNEVRGKFDNTPVDAFGGGQLGYNFQRGNVVFGVEADFGVMDLNGTATQAHTFGFIKSKIDGGFYGDVTGRLGYTFDRTLVYAKGGFAVFDGDVSVIDVGEATIKNSDAFTGWTIGAGVEHKFTPNWSLKAEYQYFDFGSASGSMPDHDRYQVDLNAHTVKVGVNYHIGYSYDPLK